MYMYRKQKKLAKKFLSYLNIKILGSLLGSPTRKGCNWLPLENVQLLGVLSLQNYLQIIEA